jgi:hypothetical protein
MVWHTAGGDIKVLTHVFIQTQEEAVDPQYKVTSKV